jgi:hypothetical protein
MRLWRPTRPWRARRSWLRTSLPLPQGLAQRGLSVLCPRRLRQWGVSPPFRLGFPPPPRSLSQAVSAFQGFCVAFEFKGVLLFRVLALRTHRGRRLPAVPPLARPVLFTRILGSFVGGLGLLPSWLFTRILGVLGGVSASSLHGSSCLWPGSSCLWPCSGSAARSRRGCALASALRPQLFPVFGFFWGVLLWVFGWRISRWPIFLVILWQSWGALVFCPFVGSSRPLPRYGVRWFGGPVHCGRPFRLDFSGFNSWGVPARAGFVS